MSDSDSSSEKAEKKPISKEAEDYGLAFRCLRTLLGLKQDELLRRVGGGSASTLVELEHGRLKSFKDVTGKYLSALAIDPKGLIALIELRNRYVKRLGEPSPAGVSTKESEIRESPESPLEGWPLGLDGLKEDFAKAVGLAATSFLDFQSRRDERLRAELIEAIERGFENRERQEPEK